MAKLQEEEYYQKLKERGITADFKQSELEKLHAMGKDEQFKGVNYNTRSKRIQVKPYQEEDQQQAGKSRHSS